jgi:hypothetical protein
MLSVCPMPATFQSVRDTYNHNISSKLDLNLLRENYRTTGQQIILAANLLRGKSADVTAVGLFNATAMAGLRASAPGLSTRNIPIPEQFRKLIAENFVDCHQMLKETEKLLQTLLPSPTSLLVTVLMIRGLFEIAAEEEANGRVAKQQVAAMIEQCRLGHERE